MGGGGRCNLRNGLFEGSVKGFLCKLAKKKINSYTHWFYSFFDLLPTWLPRNWSDRAPLMSPSGRASFPTAPPVPPPVFNWLLHVACRQLPTKTTIRFIFLIFCRLICRPKQRKIVSPNVPPLLNLVVTPPPITETVFWLVVVCLFIIWWPFTATECIFSFHFLLIQSPSKMTGNRPPQTFRRDQITSWIPAPSLVLFLVGCCVVLANGGRLKLRPGPSLYFLVASFAALNDRKISSPRVRLRSRLITNAPPPRCSRPLVGCCVYWQNSCYPRHVLRPSLNFLMGAIWALQSRDLARAPAVGW